MENQNSPAPSETPECAPTDPAAIAEVMTALSHPRRVRILNTLLPAEHKGMTFETLLAATGLSVSTLSHHLKPMQSAGLVERRRRGVNVFIRLRREPCANALSGVASLLKAVETTGRRPSHPGAFAPQPKARRPLRGQMPAAGIF